MIAICRAPIPRRQRPPTRELRPVAGGRGTTVAASGRTCSRRSGFHHRVIVGGAAARREACGQPWSARGRAGWQQRGRIRASVIPALARPALQQALGRRGPTRLACPSRDRGESCRRRGASRPSRRDASDRQGPPRRRVHDAARAPVCARLHGSVSSPAAASFSARHHPLTRQGSIWFYFRCLSLSP